MLKVITSWDDGNRQDLKLAKLLRKYQIPAIFFIPNITHLTDEEIKELSKDFEIGGHTVSHPEDLKRLSPEEQYFEIDENKKWLENIIGSKLEWFAYPSGRYLPDVTCDIVKKAGYLYARTTVVGYSQRIDPMQYRLKTTIHLADRKEYRGLSFMEFFNQYISKYLQEDGVLHIWGHTADLDRDDTWHEVEELFKYIRHLGLQPWK